jgi:hypothetical protein
MDSRPFALHQTVQGDFLWHISSKATHALALHHVFSLRKLICDLSIVSRKPARVSLYLLPSVLLFIHRWRPNGHHHLALHSARQYRVVGLLNLRCGKRVHLAHMGTQLTGLSPC